MTIPEQQKDHVTDRIDVDGKVIVNRGRTLYGRAHALLLGARGARVVVNDIGSDAGGHGRSAEPAETVGKEIVVDAGGRAVAKLRMSRRQRARRQSWPQRSPSSVRSAG